MLRKILRKSSAQESQKAFFIHTQQKRAALRIDIRCCTWPTHYCSNFNFCSKNILQKHCNKIKFVWFCCSVFAAFFCFLTIKYTFETWFPRGPRVQQVFAEILCLLYNNMSSQEEHIKLNDKEKFKLIEFYKKDPGKNVSCIKS